MMNQATLQNKDEIYRIWKDVFAEDDNGYTDYYFKYLFSPKDTTIIEKEGAIVATLQARPHKLWWNHQSISTSIILGIATKEEYRHQGMMKELLSDAIDKAQKQEMITLIQAYNPKLYEPYGFFMTYYRQKYLVDRNCLPLCDDGVSIVNNALILESCYRKYIDFKDGAYLRSATYFKYYQKEIKAQHGKIIAHQTGGDVDAYLVYQEYDNQIEVNEFIYQDMDSTLILLSYLKDKEIIVHVPLSENLDKWAKRVDEPYGFTMMKINDEEAFANFLNIDVSDLRSYIEGNKNLFMHEYA